MNRLAEREGPRRIIFEGSRSYVGEWSRDQKDGFGTQTFASGKYEGEWRNGKPHGKGSLWKNIDGRLRKCYAGDWVAGT